MEKLDILIKEHFETDKSRSSLSNLLKKIKLDNELFNFINSYLDFGTLRQKYYHYTNKIGKEHPMCKVCNKNKINWVDSSFKYRTACSASCCGKLTNTPNPNRKVYSHPKLSIRSEFIEYFNTNKIKLMEGNINNIYPELATSILEYCKFNTDVYAEKVYYYLYDLKARPICKHCNYNTVSFDTFSKGYHDYCSVKCSSNSTEKKNKNYINC
jgi:hypothetical protein